MLRRKNNQFEYVQVRKDQSPYRFQRKNNNLSPRVSPGLSPIRCRTPTRNVSPFALNNFNQNNQQRTHSPIKLGNAKVNGFYRNQQQNINSKYVSANEQVKKQIHFANQQNSKLKYYQTTDKVVVHEKTKLFSNLVSKLNSSKRKQPQLLKKNTKTQHEQYDKYQDKQNQIPFIKKKSRPQEQLKNLQCHIVPVQSVIYQHDRVSEQYYGQNYQNHQNYLNNNNDDRKSTSSVKNIKNKILKPVIEEQLAKKVQKNIHLNNPKLHQKKDVYHEQDQEDYDDVRVYLDKLKDIKTVNMKESVRYGDVKDSLMNMDPFL